MSTKAEQVRRRADAIEKQLPFMSAHNSTVKNGVALLREFADRLDAVAVSDAMVERFLAAYEKFWRRGVTFTPPNFHATRQALESVLPDEQVM